MSKISQLDLMPQSDLSVFTDVLPILDASAGTVKKISVNTLQGYTNAADPTANIASLCTTDYTVANAYARVLSGRLAVVEAKINNGNTGFVVSATTPHASSENIITLPTSLFARIVMIEQFATAASSDTLWLPVALPIKAPSLVGIASPTKVEVAATVWSDRTSFIPPASRFDNGNGNLSGLVLRMLVLLKNDVVLPYSS